MKPKDALIKDGFPGVKAGKGRLSREAIERCKELAAAGWTIDGYSVSSQATEDKPAVVAKAKPTNGARVIADIPDERRSEDNWTAHCGGKQIGMREVCASCGNSLTYCYEEKSFFRLDYKTVSEVVFKPIREKG